MENWTEPAGATSDEDMTSDLVAWLSGNAGKPIPCAICGTPTNPQCLREVWTPHPVLMRGVGWIVPETCVWVCPSCPG